MRPSGNCSVVSIRVLTWVFEQSPAASGTDQLVLLALASCAHEDGGGAYPSLATLVRMTRLSRREVVYVLARLRADGVLASTQDRPRGGVTYRILMASTGAPGAPVTGARRAPVNAATSARRAPPPVQGVHSTGAPGAPEPVQGVHPIRNGTVLNRPVESSIPPKPPRKRGGRDRHVLSDEQLEGIAAWSGEVNHG